MESDAPWVVDSRGLLLMSEGVTRDRCEVLVIDDEPTVRDALRMILEDQGHSVTTAINGHDGVEQARRKKFSMMIIDLCLPDMSGVEIMDALCRGGTAAGVPFILINSCGSADIHVEARRRGAVGELSKPFLPSEILQLIALALAPPSPPKS